MVTTDCEPGFEWTLEPKVCHSYIVEFNTTELNMKQQMLNGFNDNLPYISLPYLMLELSLHDLTITHVLRVTHLGTGAVHHVVVLADMCYMCNCAMSMNMGIPCSQYFCNNNDSRGPEFPIPSN